LLFSSPLFLFLFLPLVIAVYWFLIAKGWPYASKCCVICASLVFYAWSAADYLPVLIVSILLNYLFGAAINGSTKKRDGAPGLRKAILVAGVAGNVALLGYFKYSLFFIEGINYVAGTHLSVAAGGLPLGISFFTFTQIAYLVDVYKEPDTESNPLDYSLFISFFPRISSGPIVRYKEIAGQLATAIRRVNYAPLAAGLFLFSIGLFKKVVLAAPCAEWADNGFNSAQTLGLAEAWITSLSYSLQLYFDFSGYTDMALGAALMFSIKLPVNFNSPYRATSIQDFWGRWHMTLGRFLRDYIYIPLGGSRFGELRTFRNLLVTFLICGLWHGSGGLFVFWGLLHGVALVVHRLWKKTHLRMNAFAAWCITFGFINTSWVFFRAKSWANAVDVIKGMAGLHGIKLPASWAGSLSFLSGKVAFTRDWLEATQGSDESILVVAALLLATIVGQTSSQMAQNVRPRTVMAMLTGIMLFVSFIYIFSIDRQTPFIYFRF
jgi:alginate O-acetyltransferase complex protein AlgI